MRRIYESDAVVRDDAAHTPVERDRSSRRAIDWANASHALVPVRLRRWAVDVDVATGREVYPRGEPVDLRVTLRNRLPFPVVLRTRSPVRWRWAVDGLPEAAAVRTRSPPDRAATLSFARTERKTFTRTWHQCVRETDREWSPVATGEYTVSAWIDVENPRAAGLAAETTVRIVP